MYIHAQPMAGFMDGKFTIAFIRHHLLQAPRQQAQFNQALSHNLHTGLVNYVPAKTWFHLGDGGIQRIQNKLLFLKRTDVVVADRFIFQWFSRDQEVSRYVDTAQPVTYHRIFPPSRFASVFRRQIHCTDFNRGLRQLKASGRYDEIVSSYGVNPDATGAGS